MVYNKENKLGRPPIHTDPIKFDELVQDYFEWIEGEYEEEVVEFADANGNVVKETRINCTRKPEPPTLTGLALHLGFCDKKSLYDYQEKPDFLHSIKRAISRVEKHHEIQIAYGDKCTGNIFALKNFGWKDKLETENNHTGEITIVRKVKK